MLKAIDLHAGYGAIKAIKGVNIEIKRGEVVALLGANGAGKSTFLKVLSGMVKVSKGSVTIGDQDIKKLRPEEIVRLGVVHVPEGRRVFSGLTVLENLKMGAYTRNSNQGEINKDIAAIYNYFPILKERKNQLAGSLSGGQQQMLVIGRALMAKPKILLLDEPSLGLAPKITQEIFEIIRAINQHDQVTIFMVEQNAHMALSVATRGYVLQTGKIVFSGTTDQLINEGDIINSYLG